MQFQVRLVIIVLLFFFSSCNQPYNELIDFGYNGKVKKVILSEYLNPKDSSGDWHADKEPRFTRTSFFNDDGMVTEESIALRDRSYTKKYILKGGKKIESGETGDEAGHSRYSYTDSTMVEKYYNSSGTLSYEAETFFSKNKLTTKEVYKSYNNQKVIDYNTNYFTNRINGYVSKFFIYDSINKIKTSYENVILEKDKKNNPIRILRKKDGLPESLRVFKFEYK